MASELNRRALLWCLIAAFIAIGLQPQLLTQLGLAPVITRTRKAESPLHTPSTSASSLTTSGRSASSGGQWSLDAVAAAYASYAQLANAETARMRAAFARLPAQSRAMGSAAGYEAKLDRLERAESANGDQLARVARLAMAREGLDAGAVASRRDGSVFRAREAMQHFVRDWSEEGREERAAIIEPILDVLRLVPMAEREGLRVLVPGAGLGRLAWDISELGFNTTANELSAYMTFALHHLLHAPSTPSPNAHSVQPWAHRFSHQLNPHSSFRSIPFPDVLPRLSPRFALAETDFLTLRAPEEGYDFIATLFFIDTSADIAATLRQIHALLRPGGRWVNLGPLLWAGGQNVGLELSLEEVLQIAEMTGLRVVRPQGGVEGDGGAEEVMRKRSVRCLYTDDKKAMFERTYHAQFFVADKV